MNRLIDLSHTITDGLVTYKGLPAPIVCDYLSRQVSRQHYAEGVEFHIGRIDMVANTGTYIDAPFHRYSDGKDIAQLTLEMTANLEGVCVTVEEDRRRIDESVFRELDVRNKAVLVHTGWSRHWNTEGYYEGHPFLTQAAAQWLRDQGAALVGIDSHNIDDTEDKSRPVHSTLLGANIPIVEHMCRLEQVPDKGFKFYATPVKVCGLGTFPVRAFAQVDLTDVLI